ncbi:MAG: hypothetical protein ACYDH8_03535 [Syntrophales bacterium]
MSIPTIFALQIIADLIFCLIIVFLLARLRKSFDREKSPAIDQELFLKLQNLINQSQGDSERFLGSLDENCRRFEKLALSLEAREKQLAALLKEIDLKIGQSEPPKRNNPEAAGDRDYTSISGLLKRGLSVEEIAERTGVPSGEISLIVDLETLKKSE